MQLNNILEQLEMNID